MKKAIKALAAIMAAGTISATAQNLQSGYFDNDYIYRFQSNPAFAPSAKAFVAMPGLGNLNASTHGTVGLDRFLFNIDGQTTTFLNPKVSASEFLSGIKDKNRVGVDLRETVLAGGWKAWGGYNTVAISARANVGVYVPGELFRLAKEGATNSSYDISHMGAQATAWAEVALSHSRAVGSKWRVGGALKVLVGGGNIDARFHNANLTLGTDTWTATVDAQMNNSVKNLRYKEDYNEHTGRHYVSGFDYGDFGIAGAGLAFDLGGVFTPCKDWEFSASVLDLGFIRWNCNAVATTGGEQTVVTDRYSFEVSDIDKGWDKLRDDVSMLYQLNAVASDGGRTTALGTTLNFGARYTLPVYRPLSFGLLNTTRIQGAYSWTDFRLSATVSPVKCFSATTNLGVGTFGASFGWLLNLHTPHFGLFVASDCTPGRLAKQGVPLNSNLNLNIGINFPL